MDIKTRLFELQDQVYADFQSKLTPNVPRERIIGVRVPDVRKIAKALIKEPEAHLFMNDLPHRYYDENMLHGLLISEMKHYEECVEAVDAFLPYVDNWAVCDVMSPKIFRKNKPALLEKIREWAKTEHVYTCRFGLEMLMNHFLDGDFREEYLDIPAAVRSEEYYVNMMIAWFFATALTKQWESALPYLKDHRLSVWVHNKTLQKARESYRVTAAQKDILRTLKRMS